MLADRLQDVTRNLPLAADIGAQGGEVGDALMASGKVEQVISLEPSHRLLRQVVSATHSIVASEELLPLAEGTFDLIASGLALQSVNDLPGTLIQINRCLKPDGLFLAAIFGGETLFELRAVMIDVESQLLGGASPRVAPMVRLQDLAGLMQRAGFALPVVDQDQLTVTYDHPLKLISDLRGAGLTLNTKIRDRRILPRAFWPTVAALYQERHGNAEGRITASFDILHATGWAPGPGQPRPLRPGSAKHRLADVLGTAEIAVDDISKP